MFTEFSKYKALQSKTKYAVYEFRCCLIKECRLENRK